MIRQATFQTMMPPNGKVFFDRFPTGASLACSPWVNFYQRLTGTFCLESQLLKERTPRGIVNLLTKNAFRHSENVEFLDRDKVILSDKIGRKFVLKIVASIENLLVNITKLCNGFSPAVTAFLASRGSTLCNAKPLLFGFVILPIIYLRSIRKRSKGFNTNVDANSFVSSWQWLRLSFNRKASIPFRAFTLNGKGLDLAGDLTVEFHLHLSDFGQVQLAIIRDAESKLFVGEGVVPVSTLKAGKSCFRFLFDTSKEVLKRTVNTFQNVLQDLRVDGVEVWSNQLQIRQLSRLVAFSDIDTVHSPSVPSLLQSGVIKLSTQIKRLVKFNDLSGAWVQSKFIRLFDFRHTALSLRAGHRPRLKENKRLSTGSAVVTSNSETLVSEDEMTVLSTVSRPYVSRIADRIRKANERGRALSLSQLFQHQVQDRLVQLFVLIARQRCLAKPGDDISASKQCDTYWNTPHYYWICSPLSSLERLYSDSPYNANRRRLISPYLKIGALRRFR